MFVQNMDMARPGDTSTRSTAFKAASDASDGASPEGLPTVLWRSVGKRDKGTLAYKEQAEPPSNHLSSHLRALVIWEPCNKQAEGRRHARHTMASWTLKRNAHCCGRFAGEP